MSSRKNKIQLLVDDETATILSLLHRFDKARFTELCLKEGFKSPVIRELFTWRDESEIAPKKKTKSKDDSDDNLSESVTTQTKPKISSSW